MHKEAVGYLSGHWNTYYGALCCFAINDACCDSFLTVFVWPSCSRSHSSGLVSKGRCATNAGACCRGKPLPHCHRLRYRTAQLRLAVIFQSIRSICDVQLAPPPLAQMTSELADVRQGGFHRRVLYQSFLEDLPSSLIAAVPALGALRHASLKLMTNWKMYAREDSIAVFSTSRPLSIEAFFPEGDDELKDVRQGIWMDGWVGLGGCKSAFTCRHFCLGSSCSLVNS